MGQQQDERLRLPVQLLKLTIDGNDDPTASGICLEVHPGLSAKARHELVDLAVVALRMMDPPVGRR